MAEPVLVGLLFADRVITENNNKKGIIGTFTNFHSYQYPVAFPPWYIYAAVTNIKGEHNFSINLANDKSQHVIVSFGGKIGSDDLKAVCELSIPLVNVMFPEPGAYNLIFNIDGKQIGSRVLEVVALKQKES